MSTALVEAGSRFLATRTSRRGFLRRSALVGSALVVAPVAYALRPGTAYSAICTCAGTACGCGAKCCDGYTEFCCTISGVNACPAGTVAAGWWKADGSGFCEVNGSSAPRYYIDCNVETCGGCGCGSSGTCASACVDCRCECGNDDCGNRKTCCTAFRYGQCNQDIACVGPIVCRVVSCVPPWDFDGSCTTASATDNNTRFHNAGCLHTVPLIPGLPAVVSGVTWSLRSSTSAGAPTNSFQFGQVGDVPVMGDWTGRGVKAPGVVRGVRFGRYGQPALTWHLRSANSAGEPDLSFEFGRPGDLPVVGDWVGNGVDTPGVFRDGTWLLRSRNSSGEPDIVFDYGRAGDVPLVGDWNGDGTDTPGVVRGNRWLLRNANRGGPADLDFDFGLVGDRPVAGDWDGDGVSTPGVVREGEWQLRNSNSAGSPDLVFAFGDPQGTPVVWGAL